MTSETASSNGPDRPEEAQATDDEAAKTSTMPPTGPEPEQEIIDVTQKEPAPADSPSYKTREKSIKRKQEDTKSLLAMTLTIIVFGVMLGGWWGWMQGKDLQEFATFTVPVFTLAAAALAFYDRGRSK